MCGRYALALRPSEVRRQLEHLQTPVDEAPDDDDNTVRQSYNFAPGYHGLVYRADGPDQGGSYASGEPVHHDKNGKTDDLETALAVQAKQHSGTRYKLQSMKWGLIPFWTKRNPDYGSVMKTINCRDDSLYEDRGMWTSMKRTKRCVVVAQGFYEWLKKNNGKEKIPHYTQRKDGQLMCFAGLWDCVQYENSDEKHYTYTIITTDSNKQLKFLHDRMPVILDKEAVRTWLDPSRTEWSNDLQSLLKPFDGALECYPVSKEVGKVGNNSPSFIVPIDSAENKNNIANFFGNQRKAAKSKQEKDMMEKTEDDLKVSMAEGATVGHDVNESRGTTSRVEGTEDNAPLPVPAKSPYQVGEQLRGIKRERVEDEEKDVGAGGTTGGAPQQKSKPSTSPTKPGSKKAKTRSATSNGSAAKRSPAKGDGSRKITSFFGNQ